MIECIAGLILLLGGTALCFGILSGIAPLGGFEFIAGSLTALAGAVMLAHGVFRQIRDRCPGEPHGLRTKGLAFASLAAAVGITVAGVAALGQVTFAGVPVGYHAVTWGVPLTLFFLFYAFTRKQSAIDRAAQVAVSSGEPHLGE